MNTAVDELLDNTTVKDLLEDKDEVIQQLTADFLDSEIGWDEYYDLVRQRLYETQHKPLDDYDRAMKGI